MTRKKLDLAGKRFGNLEALFETGERRNGKIVWRCKCDCGNLFDACSDKLSLGLTKGCGCGKLKAKYDVASGRYYTDNPAMNAVIRNYWISAARRNFEWNLSLDQVSDLFAGDCFYCGSSASLGNRKAAPSSEFIYNGIDRLDSDKGYCPDNCVSCCARCNYIKGDMNVKEFLKFIKEVYEYRIAK